MRRITSYALILVGGMLCASACSTQPARLTAGADGQDMTVSINNASLSEKSIYQLNASWTDQDNQPLSLASFRGRPVMMAMVFTNCGFACPTIVRDMKRVAEALPPEYAERMQFVLVSMDPERDTPEVLRNFAAARKLDAAWTLLTGNALGVRMLAALTGVKYKAQADGQFSHSNIITVLDGEGEIVHQQEDLSADAAAFAHAVDGALRK